MNLNREEVIPVKGFPRMTPDDYAALVVLEQRRSHAAQEAETAEWDQARANASVEALSTLVDWLAGRPYRVFFSQREVLPVLEREYMEDAQWKLVQRIQRFREQGKDTRQLTEQYMMVKTSHLLRCVVKVDDRVYGWYKYHSTDWETGDRLKVGG